MGNMRKVNVRGICVSRNREEFGPALEHLSRYLNLHIRGLESKVRDGKVSGQTLRRKGVRVAISIGAYFSDGQKDGKARMTYSIDSKDGRKAKKRIGEVVRIFSKYSGPFAEE